MTIGESAAEALKKNGFDAAYVPHRDGAIERIQANLKPGLRIGFGGSMTVAALGIKEQAAAAGAVVLDHGDPSLGPEQKAEIRRAQQTCDLFICSTNALTLDGMLVNVDGMGNRINAMTFGPRKVLIIAGTNKIVSNEEAALKRIREIAAPLNNKRLGTQNPCVVSGICQDCSAKTRICRIYSTLRRKPSGTDITVLIIDEHLGF